MSDVDPAEFGPASKFLANYDYYEIMGKALSMTFEDREDAALIPGVNFEPDQIRRVYMGFTVQMGRHTGFMVEWDPERTDEIVSYEVGLSPEEKSEISGAGSWRATEVAIVEWE